MALRNRFPPLSVALVRPLTWGILLGLLVSGRAPADTAGPGSGGFFHFADVAEEAGLRGLYWKGAMRTGKIITSEGSGIAWGDYDGDGWLDLYLPQGVTGSSRNCGRLYRSDGFGGFEDFTERSGLAACGWGMGALWQDLDGDGALDLVLSFVGKIEIWWNRGEGAVTHGAAPARACWATRVAAIDFDRDRHLDLYVACYLETTLEEERDRNPLKPKLIHEYDPQGDHLLRNEGQRRFRDVSGEAGVAAMAQGRGLTVLAADLDRDGWTDIFVANDRDPNHLLHNRGDGTFEELGDLAGVSRGETGDFQAGMGVGAGDLDGNGWLDLVVTNFSGEPANLFLNHGELVFVDESRRWGLEATTWPWLSWSTELVDFDNDGLLDLYVANAHLIPEWVSKTIALFDRRETVSEYFRGSYRQPFYLFRQEEHRLVPELEIPDLVVRGASAADFDRDGRMDLLLYSSHRSSPTILLENRSVGGHWVGLEVTAGGWNPHPGTEVVVRRGRERHRIQVISGGSYLSGSSRPLHLGVGPAERVDLLLEEGSVLMRDLPVDRNFVLAASP